MLFSRIEFLCFATNSRCVRRLVVPHKGQVYVCRRDKLECLNRCNIKHKLYIISSVIFAQENELERSCSDRARVVERACISGSASSLFGAYLSSQLEDRAGSIAERTVAAARRTAALRRSARACRAFGWLQLFGSLARADTRRVACAPCAWCARLVDEDVRLVQQA